MRNTLLGEKPGPRGKTDEEAVLDLLGGQGDRREGKRRLQPRPGLRPEEHGQISMTAQREPERRHHPATRVCTCARSRLRTSKREKLCGLISVGVCSPNARQQGVSQRRGVHTAELTWRWR